MPKAHEVALAFRMLAKSMMQNPDADVVRPFVYFSHKYMADDAKPQFVAMAAMLPHPLEKLYKMDELTLLFDSPAIRIDASIERSKVCKIITPQQIIPAVYDCEPLFSHEEDAQLAQEVL